MQTLQRATGKATQSGSVGQVKSQINNEALYKYADHVQIYMNHVHNQTHYKLVSQNRFKTRFGHAHPNTNHYGYETRIKIVNHQNLEIPIKNVNRGIVAQTHNKSVNHVIIETRKGYVMN